MLQVQALDLFIPSHQTGACPLGGCKKTPRCAPSAPCQKNVSKGGEWGQLIPAEKASTPAPCQSIAPHHDQGEGTLASPADAQAQGSATWGQTTLQTNLSAIAHDAPQILLRSAVNVGGREDVQPLPPPQRAAPSHKDRHCD